MNPKDILGKLKAKAGIWGGLDISVPGKGQLHRVRKTGSQGVLTWFAFTLTPVQSLVYKLLTFTVVKMGFSIKKIVKDTSYFSCCNGNTRIYLQVSL